MTGSTDLCERLDWDSSFFGHPIARASVPRLTPEAWELIRGWCDAHHIHCLYLLASPADAASRRLIEETGFHLVDVRATLDRPVRKGDAGPFVAQVRGATSSDIPSLRIMAATCHRDTRFYADSRFDRRRCDDFYATWIENSCRGYADHVVVAERHGSPVGYVTLHLEAAGAARVGLLGVAEPWRRCGIGGELVRGALAWLADRSAQRVTVVTQGANVASQRLYQSLGFRTCDLALWYHRWFV